MGSLFSRFTFNTTGSRFHSSGLASNQNGIGTTSNGQTFSDRKKIEYRQINRYDAASVNHDYRKEALPEIQQLQRKNSEDYKKRVDDFLEEAASNRERFIRKQANEKNNQNNQSAQQLNAPHQKNINNRVMVRDAARADKQAFNASAGSRQQLNVPNRGNLTFREPPSRRYDPYSR